MSLPPLDDTIAAISTAPGAAAIGIVRLSGPASAAVLEKLTGEPPAPANHLALRRLRHPATGRALDEALCVVFRAPNSFTGEDMAEIQAHGNWPLLLDILDALVSLGARRAGPGEFTFRAFVNRKLDLSRAEAVADLIHARSEEGRRSAAETLAGELARTYGRWKDAILRWKALTEVSIDFTDDVREDEAPPVLAADVEQVRDEVDALVRTYEFGRAITEGVRIVLAGSPNAGKSSLFNRLLRDNRAIVHDEPGTTRDRIEEWCNLGRLPARLVDTAGLREGVGGVEAQGIARSREALGTADLVLHVVDSTAGLSPEDEGLTVSIPAGQRLGIWNKTDRPGSIPPPPGWLPVSAVTGSGIDLLVRDIETRFAGSGEPAEGAVITRRRHRDTLEGISASLGRAASLMRDGKSAEIVAVEFQTALLGIGELTGETTTEDLLGKIFGEFCIGK